MIKYIRPILFPFAILYGIVVFIRNKCYDWAFFESRQFDLPVICVGNLAVGGSGKTPVTEYLVRLLSQYKVAILSRGYGRETKGFILADANATAKSIGDEPLQYYQKFPAVTVAVCEDRITGIERLQDDHDLIILDDAFQHRKVKPGYSILLFEFEKMLHPQWLLPSGNLREPFSGYKRAQQILITKSPTTVDEQAREQINSKFSSFKPGHIAYASIQYHSLQPVYTSSKYQENPNTDSTTTVFLLTGIANTKPLLQYLEGQYMQIVQHSYPDHHKFSLGEIKALVKAFESCPDREKLILTTEKDAQRLLDASIKDLLLNLPVFFLPIKVDIHASDLHNFNQEILTYVSKHTRNRSIHQTKD
jgi:tetraacyldisaccharide 4'-kinase